MEASAHTGAELSEALLLLWWAEAKAASGTVLFVDVPSSGACPPAGSRGLHVLGHLS